jgi:arylsulfatase A-like enzyme
MLVYSNFLPLDGPALFISAMLQRIALVLLLLAGIIECDAASKPNFIFILADDLGGRDLGCYGSTFHETPNLDRLAASGMRFSQAYAACSVCSPTRASILTGKYPARLGLTDWLPGRADRPDQKLKRPEIIRHLPLEEVTVAEALKEGGYRTAFVGKWHLGGKGFFPEQQGFELNLGGCQLGHPPSYFSPYSIPTLPDGPKGEYLTDRLTDEALKFIESSRDKPFLLYLAHYAVHNPQQAKPELIEKFKKKLAKAAPATGPEFVPEGQRQARQAQNQPVYAAMLQSLDESVGRILGKIDQLGLASTTVVIFTSDNGGLSTAEGAPTSNAPLRAGKGWPYEGGVREPLLVRWPGITATNSQCDTPAMSTDYYPTLLEMAGLPQRSSQHRDGRSLVPLLKGRTLGERPLFWHYPHYSNQGGGPCGAIRVGDLKLIEWYEDMRVELFNLKNDLEEKRDLSKTQPEEARALQQQLHDWRTSLHAAMPTPNADWVPGAGKR